MSISITLIRTLVEAVERAGADTDAYFQDAGFDPALLRDERVRVSAETYDRLQLLALQHTGDRALGIHMGEHASMGAFNVVGSLVMHCRTIREALDVFFRYHRIISDCAESELVEEGDTAKLVYRYPVSKHADCNRLRGELGPTRLTLIGRAFAGDAASLSEVWFEHPEPTYAEEYERIFRAPVRFEQSCTALFGPRALLDAAQLHDNPTLYKVLREQAERQLSELEGARSVSERLEQFILQSYDEVNPDMATLSRRLGIGERTLRRRLKEEGTSFGRVLDAALGQVAQRILSEPETTIQEAAYRMGFSEASSFHRAFKRWTGTTPRQFRDEHGLLHAVNRTFR